MRLLLTIITFTLLNSCASISPLNGGKADETPPLLLKSDIRSTNFNSKTIELVFDEYIEENDIAENIKVFPLHSTFKTQINKKTLTIKFDSLLKSNTTYVLSIKNGIKDVHAGNTFNYKKVFSTGETIDTNFIKIRIPNYKNYKNTKIALLEDLPNDSLREFNKTYLYPLKEEINEFFGLKNKTYHVWVFTDANSDNKPDWFQPINFINNISTDTTYSVEITDWKKGFEIKKICSDGKYSKLYYNHNPHYYYHLFDIFGKQLENALYLNEDSALIYNLNYSSIKTEQVKTIDIKKELESMILKNIQIIKMKNKYTVYFNKPQYYTEYSNYRPILRDKTIYTVLPEFMQLYVPQKEIMDTISLKNIPILEHAKLSYLEFSIEDKFKQLYDVRIKNEDRIILSLFDVKNYEIYLEPGQYKIEVFKRSFTNEFNPFKNKNSSSPIYVKDLNLKASWDEILAIKLE
jgi:hypothetical protein